MLSNPITTRSEPETTQQSPHKTPPPVKSKEWSKPRQLYKKLIDLKNFLKNSQSPNHPYNRFLNFKNSLITRYQSLRQKQLKPASTSNTNNLQSKQPTIPNHQNAVESKPHTQLFAQRTIHVQQQDSSSPWHDLEQNDQTVFGTPGLLWKDVRMQEGLNCAYHALKNISVFLELNLTSNEINAQLQDPASDMYGKLTKAGSFIHHIAPWAMAIHKHRQKIINQNLKLKEPYPDNFKGLRNNISEAFIKEYIDANTGRIKINHLYANEAEIIIKDFFPTLQKNIVVFDEIEQMELTNKGKQYLTRVQRFKEAHNDRLGILWTEQGFNHWVGYVALKENGKITLYYLNSMEGKEPQQTKALMALLKP